MEAVEAQMLARAEEGTMAGDLPNDDAGAEEKRTRPPMSFTQVALAVMSAIFLGVVGYGILNSEGTLLVQLGNAEIARGLITFLITLVTVAVALTLVLGALLLERSDDATRRIQLGKEVLATLIGVLGTVVGFYFGTATGSEAREGGREGREVPVISAPAAPEVPPAAEEGTGAAPVE
jgi:hypothetical protein